MTKSAATLEQLRVDFHEQAQELTALRAAVDVQFKRIAALQAELDMLPQAVRKRRQTFRDLTAQPPSGNGHGRSRG